MIEPTVEQYLIGPGWLYVEQRDFNIEIKFLKNFTSSSDTKSGSKNWCVFQKDFNWLMDEIDAQNKGKAAFVIG